MKSKVLISSLGLVLAACSQPGMVTVTKTEKVKEFVSDNKQTTLPTVKQNKSNILSIDGVGDFEFNISRKVELESDLSNLALYKENINQYLVTIRAPKIQEKIEIIKISDKKEEHKQTLNFEIGQTEVIDEVDIHSDEELYEYNKKYLVFIDSVHKGTKILPFYKDVVVESQTNAIQKGFRKGKNLVGNLVLIRDSELITLGENITINAQNLISDHGTIESFSEQFAELNTEGKSGGSIIISSLEATGQLYVNMRGTRGKDGAQGAEQKLRPFKAKKGEDGLIRGNEMATAICEKLGLNGENGDRGFAGNPGENGLSGGESGEFNLSIKDEKSDLQTVVKVKPGRGGKNGSGSAGGIGGEGGDPGIYYTIDTNGKAKKQTITLMPIDVRNPKVAEDALREHVKVICDANIPVKGSDGSSGEKGADGLPGLDGKSQTSIVRIGDKVEQFN